MTAWQPAGRPIRTQFRTSGRATLVGRMLGTVGPLLFIVGTFLPWLVSGQVRRNSYAVAGLAAELGVVEDGIARFALAAWPVIGPLCILAMLLVTLRLGRIAAALLLLLGAIGLTLAATTLVLAGGRSALGVGLALAGPLTTAIGGVLMVCGGVALLVGHRQRRATGRPGPAGHPDGPAAVRCAEGPAGNTTAGPWGP